MTTAPSTEPTESPEAEPPVLVVGYSPKPEGRAALNWAVNEARLRNGRLIVVHTLEPGQVGDLTAQLEQSGLPYEVRGDEHSLDPAEDLLTAAETSGAQFIVIGLRKRSAVGK